MTEENFEPAVADDELDFHWSIYADATLAGLAVLIPLPLIDWAVETFFMRRMVSSIAKRHGKQLPDRVPKIINHSDWSLWGCLIWPLVLIMQFLKRLSRTLLYFLTIKEAGDLLSFYWHRAFLLNHAAQHNHLDTVDRAERAQQALTAVLTDTQTGPLNKMAGQIIGSIKHGWRLLWGWMRRGQDDASVQDAKRQMADQWSSVSVYLRRLAERYDQAYETLRLDAAIRVTEVPPTSKDTATDK